MKTNNERTKNILRKTRKIEKQRKIVKRATVTSLVLAFLTAINLVLFTPYKNTEAQSVEKYKKSEYYTVICALDRLTPKYTAKKTYKNNFDKWTDGLSTALGFGGVKGADMSPNTSGDVMYQPEEEVPENAPSDGEQAEGSSGGYAEDGAVDINGSYVETTDNQVQGVIEGDLFKRTKSHVFYLEINQPDEMILRVFSIAKKDSIEVNALKIDMQGGKRTEDVQPQIYLSSDGKKLTLLTCVSQPTEGGGLERYTVAIGYDVSNPTNVTEISRTYLTGNFISSRMTDGSLLLLNSFNVAGICNFEDKRTYLPHYGTLDDMKPVAGKDIVCPENATAKRYTVVCEIDASTFEVIDCTALFSYTSEAYVSAENIFITRGYTTRETLSETEHQDVTKTEISCVYYGGEGLEYKGSATVYGSVKNQYSMDEYEGILRVAVTNGGTKFTKTPDGESWRWTTTSLTAGSLYCIDITNFQIVASVEEFIKGETVESVRFDKDKAYVCTAVVITFKDPVFAFDLSDLNNITYVDTGVIEGYSTSLVNFKDGYLLGIGYGAKGGLKVEIYCETENKVESVCSYEIEGTFSEDYKSYYIDRERGFIGLCVYEYRGAYFYSHVNTYYLLQFDGYGLTVKSFTVTAGYNDLSLYRATVIEDYLYIVGPGGNKNFFAMDIS
nr:beta-propeller domain-containing protein [Clostridia bacterium]